MTKEEAYKIFDNWQAHIEVFDKFTKIFSVIPESFLPYNVEMLEEALNIVAKDYFDSGNIIMSENIKETISLHTAGLFMAKNNLKMSDEEAFLKMKNDLEFIFQNESMKNLKLELLKESSESWLNLK